MTITEANAANEIADEVILLAAAGVQVPPELEQGVGILLINAQKALMAGYDSKLFFAGLAAARANSQRAQKR